MDDKVFKVTEEQELNNFVKYTKNYIIVSDVDDKLISLHKAIKWLKGELFEEDIDGNNYVCSSTADTIDEFIEQFKKAMEND